MVPATQPQYTDTRPTSPSADPTMPGRVASGVLTFNSLVQLDLGKRSTVKVVLLLLRSSARDCLIGLVAKASALEAEDPGFESRLRRQL